MTLPGDFVKLSMHFEMLHMKTFHCSLITRIEYLKISLTKFTTILPFHAISNEKVQRKPNHGCCFFWLIIGFYKKKSGEKNYKGILSYKFHIVNVILRYTIIHPSVNSKTEKRAKASVKYT